MERRRTQLLKGVLDMCMLKILAAGDCYGYEITKKLQAQGLELAREGSIYPLLARLEKAGFVDSYLVRSREGPNRKYYRLSVAGREQLSDWEREWVEFYRSVNQIIGGGSDGRDANGN
ncbi:MAG: PadR family transcriptional regulator [Firmicutes bacterium]|nr:PadR family transcriptional regulator [Bacillota bacterium]